MGAVVERVLTNDPAQRAAEADGDYHQRTRPACAGDGLEDHTEPFLLVVKLSDDRARRPPNICRRG